jgi:hypothetical protein
VTLGAAAFAVALLAFTGFIDARERFPVSRRQYVPLAVTVIASIPVFLVPPLAYVMTYWAGGGGSKTSRIDEDDSADV